MTVTVTSPDWLLELGRRAPNNGRSRRPLSDISGSVPEWGALLLLIALLPLVVDRCVRLHKEREGGRAVAHASVNLLPSTSLATSFELDPETPN
jgi:hypothetical protein